MEHGALRIQSSTWGPGDNISSMPRVCTHTEDISYKLAQSRQCRQKRRRRLSLSVYPIEHKHEFFNALQHPLQMRDKRADILTPAGVCLNISIHRIGLQALVHCCSRPLKQVSTRNAFLTIYSHALLTACIQV